MSLVLPSTKRLKQFYKQTFEIKYKGKSVVRHTLLVNPEEMSMDDQTRSNVTQTLGGAYIDDFGRALGEVSLSGLTGYKARRNADGIIRDGYTEIKHLRDEVYRRFIDGNSKYYSMYWYDWENEDFYEIYPTNFRLSRNKNQPILYRYDLRFQCLRQIGKVTAPRKDLSSDPTIPSEAQGVLFSSVSNTSELLTAFRTTT